MALDSPQALKARLMQDVITAKITGSFSMPAVQGIALIGQSDEEVSFTAENGREALPVIAQMLSDSRVKSPFAVHA